MICTTYVHISSVAMFSLISFASWGSLGIAGSHLLIFTSPVLLLRRFPIHSVNICNMGLLMGSANKASVKAENKVKGERI